MWAGPSAAAGRAGGRGVVHCDRPADEWCRGRATRRGQWPEDRGGTGTRGAGGLGRVHGGRLEVRSCASLRARKADGAEEEKRVEE